ncbi:hypothetical protein TWF481_011529 [Arthrobotrys musiformis]|uniref:Peptidase A1 domain-containing protein n=1 Tax=Arthrobotrys musiformis TaxID=47236 RepID=A0AAV9W0F5_9PEZI
MHWRVLILSVLIPTFWCLPDPQLLPSIIADLSTVPIPSPRPGFVQPLAFIPAAAPVEGEVPPSSLFVNIDIGEPPQKVSLAVSFSALTWIPTLDEPVSEFCSDPVNMYFCMNGRWSGYFNTSRSESWSLVSDPFTINYSGGRYITGALGSATITLNGPSFLAELIFATSPSFPPTFGLGILPPLPPAVPNFTLVSTPNQVRSEGSIEDFVIGIYVNPNRKSIGNPGGISFGLVDTAKFYGGMVPVRMGDGGVIEAARVELVIEKERGGGRVDVNDMIIKVGKMGLDPTLDGIYIINDSALHTTILAALTDSSYTYEKSTNKYITLCESTFPSTNHSIQFDFSDGELEVRIKVTVEQLTYKLGDGRCYIAVHNGPDKFAEVGMKGVGIVLGLSFFRSAYLLYNLDNSQLSIATSVPDSTSQNLISIDATTRENRIVGTGPPPMERPRNQDSSPKINSRKIGIAVGSALGGLLILGSGFLLRKRWRKRPDVPVGGQSVPEHASDETREYTVELEGDKPGKRVRIELLGAPVVEADRGGF